MWRRDPGVGAMVEWLDRGLPDKLKIPLDVWQTLSSSDKFESCSAQDRKAILEQARECCNDFSYAARNYFWIVNKDKQDQLFSLWEGQHLILQKYYDLKEKGRSQKIIVVKARQLGVSILVEAMLAWRAMFFPNTNALVVASSQPQTVYLFGLMKHIYDRMPWWLKPMTSQRKEEEVLIFDNPDANMRNLHPGLNSRVAVQFASQYSGVGEGIRLDAVHASEFAGWDEGAAEEIIDEDMGNALHDNSQVFGFLESTAKGAGTYAHRMWRSCEKRMERAEWYPLFLPWFFETTRVLAPPQGWHPQKQESQMRDRVSKEWCNCANCGHYRLAFLGGESTVGITCPECGVGTLGPVTLKKDQLYWKQEKREQAEAKGQGPLKKHLQEMATTAEEAFQISGYQLFNDGCQEWVNACVEPPSKIGRIYRQTGEIHGPDPKNHGKCFVKTCRDDHRYDECPLQVWREPEPRAEYTVAVDVAEGIGEDFSVVFVNKVGKYGAPDEQVAVWRDNRTPPKELAFYANVIGRWYNDAMMCVEYNTYQTTGDDLVYVWQYPNIFRWKNKETVNVMTHKWHWWTKVNTKAYLHQTAVHWLQNNCWVIHSSNFKHEMTVYKKDDFDSRTVGAAEGFHDDEIMAGMISLYCLAPETRVLTSDLRWVPIGECAVGDKLVSFDEDIACKKGNPCLLREAEITSHRVIQEPRFEIVTDKGTVIASGHHGWATVRNKAHDAKVRSWAATERLKPGDKIIRFNRPWECDSRPESQCLAGLMDGEGCIGQGHNSLRKFGRDVGRGNLSFSQNPGLVLDKALLVCKDLDIDVVSRCGGNGSKVKVVSMRVASNHSSLEIVGRLRPVRLLQNARSIWEGRPFIGWHWPMETATVISVKPIGVGPVVSIGTTTKTFFAEGLASHNCSHEMDTDESGRVPIPNRVMESMPARYRIECQKCAFGSTPDAEDGRWPWVSDNPEREGPCPRCGSIQRKGASLAEHVDHRQMDIDQAISIMTSGSASPGDGKMRSALWPSMNRPRQWPNGPGPDFY